MAQTRFIQIIAQQNPFTIGLDAQKRNMFSMNFQCKTAGLMAKFEECIIKILSDAALCTFNVNCFSGPTSVIPDGDGPFTLLINTGGYAPEESKDDYILQNPSFQILIYGMNYVTTRDKADQIWRELHGKRDLTVTV